jgi:hypothetical protein
MDYCQGVAVYDNLTPDAGVSWINWDMDHAFYDGKAITYKVERENWEQAAFAIVYKKRHYCGRTKLFSRLINESKAYRNDFLNLATELLNHRLTHGFLQERVAYYEHMLKTYGELDQDYISMLNAFMDHRTDFVFNDMHDKFGGVGPYSCDVIGASGQVFLVDGYRYSSEYTGKYFQSTPVTISVPLKAGCKYHWLVNGRKITDKKLFLHLDQNTTIQYVVETDKPRSP